MNLPITMHARPGDRGFALVRNRDPQTSHKAAERAETFKSSQSIVILESLLLHGPQTAKDMEMTTCLNSVQVSRRTGALEDSGQIRATGVERDGCREFELVAA